MATSPAPFGKRLREWRKRRRTSQLNLSLDAGISSRHLSFVETGRSRASRALIDRLCDTLAVPLRDRNQLLMAAGYSPRYLERDFNAPALAQARATVERIIACHMPFPALAVDRHWNLLAANASVTLLMSGVSPDLLEPPVNVLRLSLHPDGLAPAIVNLAEWKHHLVDRLGLQVAASGDVALESLLAELKAYPAPASAAPHLAESSIAIPLVLRSPAGRLSFLSTTTVFGTPVEVTLSEIAIETFFPADEETAERLRQLG